MADQPLFDVIVYDLDEFRVVAICGKRLVRETGSFHTAEKCIDRVYRNLNDHHGTSIVPTGKYGKGQVVTEEDQ